ncbi:ankyrin repeat domain-containing protein [Brevibacillus laterosporus]|nr:ankyrin repeat domain-containing protein [Brevibacillus laterosporus]TPG87918.1 ankyrin repeat domain-containing protein [Brevibacillus laterosporus]
MKRIVWLMLFLIVIAGSALIIDNSPKEHITYNDQYDDVFNPKEFLKAARDGDLIKVEFFIVHNINPNVTNTDGRTALYYAALEKNYEIGNLLLDNNADPNIKDYYEGSPLTIAKGYNDQKLIEILVNKGAID